MSVSILISGNNIPEKDWKNIPLASEESFRTLWMPICKELNLEFIPLFEVGFEIDLDSLNCVLQELNLVKHAMEKKSAVDSRYKAPLEKIDSILASLPLIMEKHSKIFIG